MVTLCKSFQFEAAHWLPYMPEGHKCRRLHGHSFKVDVEVSGLIDADSGLLMDFGDIKAIVKPIIDQLDHQCLNYLGEAWQEPLLINPSSENLSCWLWRQIKPKLPMLSQIVVYETCSASCRYAE